MRAVHIERKGDDAEIAAEQLVEALRREQRLTVTASDASILSGLPLHQCEPALLVMASRYPAALEVDDEGDIRFQFEHLDPPNRLLGRLAERWRRYAAKYGPPLQTWFVWNLLLLLLMAFFASIMAFGEHNLFEKGPKSADAVTQDRFVPAMICAVVLVLAVFPVVLAVGWVITTIEGFETLPWYAAIGRPLIFGAMVLGLGWVYYRLSRGILNVVSRGRDPAGALKGFLFGPKREREDPLADERRLTALIASRDGVISAAELVELFGWTLREADAELVRILVDYGGDITVTDDGVLVFRFDELVAERTGASAAPEPAHAGPLPRPPFFGCGQAFVWAAFAFLFASAVLTLARPDVPPFPLATDYRAAYALKADELNLLFVPGIGLWFHTLVGAWLLLRLAPWLGRVRATATRRRLLDVIAFSAAHPAGRLVEPDRFSSRQLTELHAELDVDRTAPDGRVWLSFPELSAGRQAAEAVRAASSN